MNDAPVIRVENFKVPRNKRRLLSLAQSYRKNYVDSGHNEGSCNYIIEGDEFFVDLYEEVFNYASKLFQFTLSPSNKKSIHCYYSDDKNYKSILHNHQYTSTINIVYYLNVPSGGGGELLVMGCDKRVYLIPVKSYDLVIMPNFVEHCPLPPKSNEPRISLNMEIKCEEPAQQIFKDYA